MSIHVSATSYQEDTTRVMDIFDLTGCKTGPPTHISKQFSQGVSQCFQKYWRSWGESSTIFECNLTDQVSILKFKPTHTKRVDNTCLPCRFPMLYAIALLCECFLPSTCIEYIGSLRCICKRAQVSTCIQQVSACMHSVGKVKCYICNILHFQNTQILILFVAM